MSPGPQQRLLNQILGPLPIAITQSQRVNKERVTMFGMQRAE